MLAKTAEKGKGEGIGIKNIRTCSSPVEQVYENPPSPQGPGILVACRYFQEKNVAFGTDAGTVLQR